MVPHCKAKEKEHSSSSIWEDYCTVPLNAPAASICLCDCELHHMFIKIYGCFMVKNERNNRELTHREGAAWMGSADNISHISCPPLLTHYCTVFLYTPLCCSLTASCFFLFPSAKHDGSGDPLSFKPGECGRAEGEGREDMEWGGTVGCGWQLPWWLNPR